METTVINIQGNKTGVVQLPEVFNIKPSSALLHEVVVGYMANQRAGTHATKTRAEVSGGGAKPWRQKGTGRARAGSTRSPLWRKGGIAFGPQPHRYTQSISQKKKQQALYMALTAKAVAQGVLVIDEYTLASKKTKDFFAMLKKLKIAGKKVLFLFDKKPAEASIAAHNIPDIVVDEVRNINAYQVLWANIIVMTTAALKELEKKQGE